MNTVTDLLEWRRTRPSELGRTVPPPTSPPDEVSEDDLARLERAIRRLDSVASAALDASGALEGWVETELLAIMGALATDLLVDAALRAERLADRLARGGRSARARR